MCLTSIGTGPDLWAPDVQGVASLFFILSGYLGTAMGPLAGAYIISEYDNDWRYSMWVMMMIAAPLAVASLFLKETSPSRILYLRQKKLGLKVPHQAGDSLILLRKLGEGFLRPLHMVLVEVGLLEYLEIIS